MAKNSEKAEVSKNLDTTPVLNRVKSLLVWIPLFLIKAYRYLISPLMGNHCRFYPSCSQYGEEAYQRFGILKGTVLTIKRVLKCHPWHAGGYDPVPDDQTTITKK